MDSPSQETSCIRCQKNFSTRYNLVKHLKTVHNESPQKKIMCCICKKSYLTDYKLEKHQRSVHDIKIPVVENQSHKLQCAYCEKIFVEKKKLRRHINTHMNIKNSQKCSRIICPIDNCHKQYKLQSEFRNHASVKHEIHIEEEQINFENIQDFDRWKIDLEKEKNVTYYVNRTTYERAHNRKNTYYACNRAFQPREKKIGEKLRRPKSGGTIKINAACTSSIILRQYCGTGDDVISVTYYPTHLGHTCSIGKQFLSKEDRTAIAGKLQLGISHKRIITDIRQSDIPQDMKRIHLIEKKDLHNIQKSFQIDHPMKCHENDWISVKLWVERMSKNVPNPVLFFKQQGEEDPSTLFGKNDFALVIMTKFQCDQMQRFGCDRLCVDGTHGLNKYDFQLYTVLVVNEFNHGVPVAFCFSNKCDTQTYMHFFNCIKQRVGIINPRVFMSDDEPAFYNAWCAVMGPAGVQILCAWYILRNWRNNLCKIKSQEKKKIVFKVLDTLLRETDAEKFHSGLDLTLTDLQSDLDTVDFGTYFSNTYANRVEKWAYCYRKHLGINVNMYLEAFHRTLKHCYLEGKKCKRLDRSIYEILSLVHDKKFDCIISKEKGRKPNPVFKIQKSHDKSKIIYRNMLTELDNSRWSVSSSKDVNKKYIVERNEDNNCNLDICLMRSEECHICCHSFKCSCEDNSIYLNICKHIHACVREFVAESSREVNVETLISGLPTPDVSKFELSASGQNDAIVEQFQLKFNMLAELSRNAANFTEEKNKHLMKGVDKIIAEFQESSSFIPNADMSAARNIKPQSRFFSTKRLKKNTTSVSISKEERGIISESFQKGSNEVINIHSEFDHNYSCKK